MASVLVFRGEAVAKVHVRIPHIVVYVVGTTTHTYLHFESADPLPL